jgi:L-ascorbate metabolism protein UlaG (beta-lactamase superfamily)
MKITKYGHCCLLIEERGIRILTDPGAFTANIHSSLTGIDVILYTHEHADHYHLDKKTTS